MPIPPIRKIRRDIPLPRSPRPLLLLHLLEPQPPRLANHLRRQSRISPLWGRPSEAIPNGAGRRFFPQPRRLLSIA